MTAADLTAIAKKHPVGALCLLVTIACGVALYFRSDVITVSQAEYEAKSAEAAKMINNVKAAPGLDEQVAELQNLGKELDARLVRPGQLAVNLQYFYKLEADTGVKFLDLRQGSLPRNAGKSTFTPVPFVLSVQGTYPQLMKFLVDLQNGRHFARPVSTSFNKTGSGGENSVGSPDQVLTLSLNVELLGKP